MTSIRAFLLNRLLKKGLENRKESSQEFSIEKARRVFDRITARIAPPKSVTINLVQISGIECAWFLPTKQHTHRVGFYLHGGGYALGSIKSHKPLIAQLAHKLKIRMLAIDYRLAPEHPFPAGLEDALSVYEALIREEPQAQIVVIGDSAGGGLSLSLLQTIVKKGKKNPTAAILLSPWLDLMCDSDSYQKNEAKENMLLYSDLVRMATYYAPDGDFSAPGPSPLHGSMESLPPILVQIGTREILLDDSLRFAQRAKEQGVNVQLQTWAGMPHVFQFFFPYIPEARRAIKKMEVFLNKNLP